MSRHEELGADDASNPHDQIADLVMQARTLAEQEGDLLIKRLLDMVLLELGWRSAMHIQGQASEED